MKGNKMAGWYVRVGGKVHGPLDSAKIKELAACGKINETTDISRGDNGPFVAAGKVKGLFASTAKPSPPSATRTVAVSVGAAAPASAPAAPTDAVVPLSDAVDAVKAIGGYIGKTLLPGERLVYQGRLHWFLFLRPLWLLALAIILPFGAYQYGQGEAVVGAVMGSIVLVILALLSLVARVITYLTSEFAVTNKRVVMKQGFIRRKTMELMLNKVDSLGVDQGLLGRAFNFGTVRVAVATEKQSFNFLANPLEFRRQVQLMQTNTQPVQ
jgi:membrane protein YdbS with pleckstrin-like domain